VRLPEQSAPAPLRPEVLLRAGFARRLRCGFRRYADEWDDGVSAYVEGTTPEQVACWRTLADYLTAALRHQPTVEVLTFCSGDESHPPERRRVARPADFLTDRSLFDQWQQIVVSASEAETSAVPDPARDIGSGSS
jgi:hypothetical protein